MSTTDPASTDREEGSDAAVDADRERRDAGGKRGAYVLVAEQTPGGCATVRARARNETLHVVDYADAADRRRVAGLSAGAVVRLELSPAGRRSDVWRAESLTVVEDADGG